MTVLKIISSLLISYCWTDFILFVRFLLKNEIERNWNLISRILKYLSNKNVCYVGEDCNSISL